jgi:hypothetical protein
MRKSHTSSPRNPKNRSSIDLVLRMYCIASQNSAGERGYVMLIVSIITLLIFSLLATYLTLTNMGIASTNAFVDGSNTFYAAESGLNKRADAVRQKFVDYSVPTGLSPGQATRTDAVTPANIANCFPIGTTTPITSNDFECRNYPFQYHNTFATGKNLNDSGGSSEVTARTKTIDYVAYTFVADTTTYAPGTTAPIPQRINTGETYAGLNNLEYKYTVYSVATKVDLANPQPTQGSEAKTVLQMDFKSRVIPLFQFGAFYHQDLEINSTPQMIMNGWVHTNANLYIQPTPIVSTDPGTDFLGNITSAGAIYNRVDATSSTRFGTARVLMNSTPTYLPLPAYDKDRNTPLTSLELAGFGRKVLNGDSGAAVLSVPDAGFLRKRNYFNNQIGDYFAKADLRIEMVPDRQIPFNVTAIQNGTNASGGSCITTFTPGADPAGNYIDPDRQGTNFKCSQLNKGQLMSLSQPVLVMTRNSTEEDRFCKLTPGVTDRTRSIIDYANVVADPTVTGLSVAQKNKVLRALQTAISSATYPIDYANVTAVGKLTTSVKSTFRSLLSDSTLNLGITPTQRDDIVAAAPASIAKARQSCFLPAAVQRVVRLVRPATIPAPPTDPNPIASPSPSPANPTFWIGADTTDAPVFSGGAFYDPREQRWLSILQTNIESLTVWNRDGRYVNQGNDLTTAPATTTAASIAALNSGDPSNPLTPDAYATDRLLFVRAAANSSSPVGSFEYLGLAAEDRTEGGLVLHETVNDDLNGNGGALDPDNDITWSTSDPIYKKNPDGTNTIVSGNPIVLDYYRKYKNGGIRQSNYGFAVNGGRNLPAPLTIVTDQAMYTQGDYNSYPDAKQSAAILADTIAVLSVNCLSPTTNDPYEVIRTGQINCGLDPSWWQGHSANVWTGASTDTGFGFQYNAETTTVNAAFLAYTDQSNGNKGIGRDRGGAKYYSGGLNNYIRLLEDWSGQTLNYNGSFISLGNPIEFSGAMIPASLTTSYYSTPNRNFAYDPDFNAFEKLPPMTPRAIYLQQSVFSRH